MRVEYGFPPSTPGVSLAVVSRFSGPERPPGAGGGRGTGGRAQGGLAAGGRGPGCAWWPRSWLRKPAPWPKTSGWSTWPRAFEARDLAGVWLVISATDQPEVNREVADRARDRGVFANLVEQPELGSFLVPASLSRGDLTLAVSTGGASPAAARRLRQRLEREYGPEWGPYLRLLRAIRAKVVNKADCQEGNPPHILRPGGLRPVRAGGRRQPRRG